MSSVATDNDVDEDVRNQRLQLYAWSKYSASKATSPADMILRNWHIPRQPNEAPTLVLPHLDASPFTLAEEDYGFGAATRNRKREKQVAQAMKSSDEKAIDQAPPSGESDVWLEGMETWFNLEQLRKSIANTQHTCTKRDPRLNKDSLRPCHRDFCHVGSTMGLVEDTHTFQNRVRYANLKKAGVVRRTNEIMTTFQERLDATAKQIASNPDDDAMNTRVIEELQGFIYSAIPGSEFEKGNIEDIERRYGVDDHACNELKAQIDTKLRFLALTGKDKNVTNVKTPGQEDVMWWISSAKGKRFENLLHEEAEYGWKNPNTTLKRVSPNVPGSTATRLDQAGVMLDKVTHLANKRFEMMMMSETENRPTEAEPAPAKIKDFQYRRSAHIERESGYEEAEKLLDKMSEMMMSGREDRYEEAQRMLNDVTQLAYNKVETMLSEGSSSSVKTGVDRKGKKPMKNTEEQTETTNKATTKSKTKVTNDDTFEAMSEAITKAMAVASTGANHLQEIKVTVGPTENAKNRSKKKQKSSVSVEASTEAQTVWDPSQPFPEVHTGTIRIEGTVTFE